MIPPLGATAQSTEQYLKAHKKNFHPDKKRLIQDLHVSALAMGTYLGPYDVATDVLYEDAIKTALGLGVNLIDTAINYRCQRSERVIGRALANLIEKKKISRSQVVVASKGGFIPFDGEPTPNIRSYIQKKYVDTGIMTEDDIVSSCHSLHPNYLQNQIDQSLTNLQLETLDIYYLHNPETQLPVIGVDLFYERIRKAFEKLEENADRGKIQFYGMATWTGFRAHPGEQISLERIFNLATEVGGQDHHFRVIQLPYNLAMLEAVGILNQSFEGKNYPVISAAAFHGVSVMVSAPLLQGQLASLPQGLAQKIPGGLTAVQKALQFVTSTPSVTSAMVGMKQSNHVEENAKILATPNWNLKVLQDICDWMIKK